MLRLYDYIALGWRNAKDKGPTAYLAATPQHFLYFFPEPQGQGSLRPTLAAPRTTCCGLLPLVAPAMRACSSSLFLRRSNWASRSSTEVAARRRWEGGVFGPPSSVLAAAAVEIEGASSIRMWKR